MPRSIVLPGFVLLIAIGLVLWSTCGSGSPRRAGAPPAGPGGTPAAVREEAPSSAAAARRAVVEDSAEAAEAVEAAEPAGEAAAEPAVDPSPILVAGSVTDPDGRPLADAAIVVQEIEIPPGEDEVQFGARMVSLHPRDDVKARSDAAGCFVARGAAAGRLEVGAELRGRVLREAVECASGATDVVLVLERAGSLRATLAPGSVPLERQVLVEVLPAGTKGGIGGPVSAFAGGALRRDGLRAGYYDFVIRGRTGAATLWKAHGVAVEPGRVTEDPRLLDIDLARVLRPIVITVVDPGGRPVERATVMVFEGRSGRGQYTDADGRIELCGAADGLFVEVRAEGFRKARLAGVRQDARVELRPLIELDLRCCDAVARVPLDGGEEGRLALCLEPEDRGEESVPGAWGSDVGSDTQLPKLLPDDPTEVVRFRLDGPGRYRVWWAVGIGGGEAEPPRHWVHVHPEKPLWVDLDDVPGAQAREVAFEKGLLEKARERVRAMRASGLLGGSRRR